MSLYRLGTTIGMVLGLGAWGNLAAVEGFSVDDLRLQVSQAPATKDVHIDIHQGAGHVSEDISGLHTGGRVDLGASLHVARLAKSVELVVGVSVFDTQQSGVEDRAGRATTIVGPVKLGAQGLDLGLGLAVRVAPHWHLEGIPFAGVGFAKVTDSIINGANLATTFPETGSGTYWEYGVRAGVFYTFPRSGLQAGLGCGYLISHADGEVHFNIVGGSNRVEQLTIKGSGFAPFLTLGYRF